jgi:hypothetical protein
VIIKYCLLSLFGAYGGIALFLFLKLNVTMRMTLANEMLLEETPITFRQKPEELVDNICGQSNFPHLR